MLELIWDIASSGALVYAGVFGTRKYFRVGKESPEAVAARKRAKALSA